jgi:hypothetical protein
MKNSLDWVAEYCRKNLFIISVALGATLLLFFRLTSIPKHGNSLSVPHIPQTTGYTLVYLWHHVLYTPYTLGYVGLHYLHIDSLFAVMSIGAIYGLLAAALLYYLLAKYCGSMIALLTTAITVDSLWFLQASRLEGPLSTYAFFGLLLVAIFFVKRNDKFKNLKWVLSIIGVVSALYIPGLIWIVLLLAIVKRKEVLKTFKDISFLANLISSVSGVIILAPLVWSSIHNSDLLKQIFGLLPQFSVHDTISRFYHLPEYLFLKSGGGIYALGHQPVFDIFSIVMIIFGVYKLWSDKKLNDGLLILTAFVLSWVLVSLGIVPMILTELVLAVPIALGLDYLITTWFTVFPKNPVARGVGIGLLSLAVVSVMWLHINQFYIAWPKTPQTLQTYSQHN